MGYKDYLTNLLRPLGVYDLDGGTFVTAELAAQGTALDECEAQLGLTAREMMVLTAQDSGLEAVESLLSYRPVTNSLEQRRAALAALLRIGGDSFTLAAINDNLVGCGLNAVATETGRPGYIQVSFPNVPGIPYRYDEMKKIIEEILPCHLEIEYVFWYITWALMEQYFSRWSRLDGRKYTWEVLEKMVA